VVIEKISGYHHLFLLGFLKIHWYLDLWKKLIAYLTIFQGEWINPLPCQPG